MEKDKTPTRLPALDGLRGFAIILVFLNHITTTYVAKFIPFNLLSWLFGDGVTGVTFLFILSGFLMASIYPSPVSSLSFLQKRYTRIFPLFLSMCIVMFFYYLRPASPGFIFIGLLALVAIINHFLWIYIFKKLPDVVKRSLFVIFLILQFVIGSIYVFWIMRQPPIVFNQYLPVALRQGMIFLVNATLTLPLGDYIPMLDGVYWSLVAEVLFYLLYPIFIVPVVLYLRPQPRNVKIFFLIAITFLIAGITLLTKHILVISLIQPALWQYFVMGILLAHIYKHKHHIVTKLSQAVGRLRWGQVLLFGGLLFLESRLEYVLPNSSGPWIRIAFAFPLIFMVALLLDQRNYLAKLFTNKFLVFLGTISYSIYLSHALVIHLVERLYSPTNVLTNVGFILVTFAIAIGIAYFLFYLLEKPYFTRSKESKLQTDVKEKRLNPKFIMGGVSLLYLLTIFLAFQSRFNFFSVTYPISPSQKKEISLYEVPVVRIGFKGEANNLGLITARLTHKKMLNVPGYQSLVFSLFEQGKSEPLARTTYTLDYFNEGSMFPFGFSPIANSKDKLFIAEFRSSDHIARDYVTLDTSTLQSVYPADKAVLFKNPPLLVGFMMDKTVSVLSNPQAWRTFLLGLPFLLISLWCILVRRTT